VSVLVDTSVWSLALRRRDGGARHPAVSTLRSLIEQGETIRLIGAILQEVLQGVRDRSQFARLRSALKPFPLIELGRGDYEAAAELGNHCRSRGVQAGTIDFLIAAAAIRHRCALLTADQDFVHIARLSPLRLAVRAAS